MRQIKALQMNENFEIEKNERKMLKKNKPS